MRRSLLVLAGLVALTSRSYAGYCLSEDERKMYLVAIEKYAIAQKPPSSPEDELGLDCAVAGSGSETHSEAHDRPYLDRARAACKKIVALPAVKRKPDYAQGIDRACVTFLVESGVNAVGTRDLLALVMARPAGWADQPDWKALAGSGDPRVRGFVLDKLRAATAKVGGKKLAGWRDDAWQRYRIGALGVLAAAATTEDVAFLDELIASTPAGETKVLEAARAAVAAAKTRQH